MKTYSSLNTNRLTADILFLLGVTLYSLFTFALLRALLIFRNIDLIGDIPYLELVNSFLIGTQFDLIVLSYILIPIVLGNSQ